MIGQKLKVVLLALCCVVVHEQVQAQRTSADATQPVPIFSFASPGEATVDVLVMSSTGTTGVYRVGATTRLDELMVIAGTAWAAEVAGEEQRVRVQLFRDEGGRRRILYDKPLEEMLLEPAQYPALENGDVFVVEVRGKAKFGIRDVLPFLSAISTVTLVILRLTGG